MDSEICNAIRNMKLVEFDYNGGIRTVEAHCYGVTTAGNEALRGYQVSRYSESGQMGWKLFDLGNASNLSVLEETFDGPRPGYRKGDRRMSQIYCEL